MSKIVAKPTHLQSTRAPVQPAIKIHWRLCQGGASTDQRTRQSMASSTLSAQPDLINQIAFAKQAEQLGIDSLLVDFGANKPDSILLSSAIGFQTKHIKFIIACRSGLMSPSYFVQQLNTLSHFIPDRFALNVVAGHSPQEQQSYGDFLAHDQRYARTHEFLTICQRLWQQEPHLNFSGQHYQVANAKVDTHYAGKHTRKPELFIAGSSTLAKQLATECGDTWISLAQLPAIMADDVQYMLNQGKQVGIRLSVICRESKKLAIAAAEQLITDKAATHTEQQFIKNTDSYGIKRANKTASSAPSPWLNDCLWIGAVASHGAPAIALVGTAQEIADAIINYHQIGISQSIFSGWPQDQEMLIFGQQVLPLIRQMAHCT